jgi:hypothetical protein
MKININIIDLLSLLLLLLMVYNVYEMIFTMEGFVTFKSIKDVPKACSNQMNKYKRKCKAKMQNITENILVNTNNMLKMGKNVIKKTVFPKEIKITF